ncbi:proteasome assembly chaperone 4-like [Acanthaster planci]|uniref:Proteasome assembly chaperone 4-like n=1 Tax=Acanthaster planci TaxID=133434 RepID=A0A8B7XN13_ACAPL|nr:proteasome assembly chaperone 4-like [Acanthaster planci]
MSSKQSLSTGASEEPARSRLSVHNFTETICEQSIYFHVLCLKDSFLLWIGQQPANMSNLAVALSTKIDSIPSASLLMGEMTDPVSTTLAQKLAKLTGKQVFVSCDLPQDRMLLPLVETRIINELKAVPDKFYF